MMWNMNAHPKVKKVCTNSFPTRVNLEKEIVLESVLCPFEKNRSEK